MEKVPEPTIEDVSARFAERLAPGERVWRSVSGYLTKLRTERTSSGDAVHFRIDGELLDDVGEPAAPAVGSAHALTIHAESAVDVAAAVKAARELVVNRLEQAAIHHAAAAAIEGVA